MKNEINAAMTPLTKESDATTLLSHNVTIGFGRGLYPSQEEHPVQHGMDMHLPDVEMVASTNGERWKQAGKLVANRRTPWTAPASRMSLAWMPRRTPGARQEGRI